MRDSDDLPYVVIERHSGSLTAFLWGALLGAGAALLLAPRSGAQTQDEIRAGVRRVRTAAEDRVESARMKVNRTRTRIEDQIGTVKEQLSTVKDRIDTKADRAREALESGKRVARDARSELEKRMGDVRESYSSTVDRFGRRDPRNGQAGDFVTRDGQSGESSSPNPGTTENPQDWTGGNPDLI